VSAITAKDLARWRAGDILHFVEKCCRLRRPDNTVGPLELSERQASWLLALAEQDAEGKPRWRTVGVVSPKRSGKTAALAAPALLFKAITATDSLSVCLANSRESARALSFSEASKMVKLGPLNSLAVCERGRILFPDLGSEIRCVPHAPDTVAGLTVTGLLVSDEGWQAPSSECWDLLRSQLSGDGQALMVSQASGVKSFVYRLYETAKAGTSKGLWFDYVSPEWLAEHLSPNPFMTAEILADIEAEIGVPAIYRHYFQNVWSEGSESLFAPADVVAAVEARPFTLPRTREELAAVLGCDPRACWYGSGLDRAMPGTTTGDDSVFVTVARTPGDGVSLGQVVVVQCERLPTGSEAEVVAAVEFSHQLTGKAPELLVEVYQAADLVARLPGALLVTPSAPRQAEAFTFLARLFNERRIRIPEDADLLIGQLATFGIDTSTQPPRFGKKISGGMDDSVYGLAWACEPMRAPPPPPPLVIDLSAAYEQLEAMALDAEELLRNPGRDVHHRAPRGGI